ncbi:hypothetical protein PPYR_13311 [Photinus pyralis]|uniref:G patch domain-containing protein 11 n=1 Tax=Photinus pyralis TaxID=7054 RepID=A0A1Y1KSG8_PHOPY|nr:G patch domain-containing protein 11 [Photinus pyralis]KAB0793691.1 hypothetical protein PPYR_13311 [Photinus pyralis]
MSDSEEDYMSDKLLLGSEKDDIRPGLLFNSTQKRSHELYKQKQELVRKKPKRYAEQETETRDKGLNTAIAEDNKGFQLLQKMGYKSGSGLGKAGGITKPIDIKVKQGNSGLGTETHFDELARARVAFAKKAGKKQEEAFQNTNLERRNMFRLNKDYFKAQRTCEDLDFKHEVKEPDKPWFWTKQTMDAVRKKNKHSDSESESEDEEEERPTEAALNELINYLRAVYGYCIYCCDFVEDIQDPSAACPGLYRVDHDDL